MEPFRTVDSGLTNAYHGFIGLVKFYLYGIAAQIGLMLASVPGWLAGAAMIQLGTPNWFAILVGITGFIIGLSAFGWYFKTRED